MFAQLDARWGLHTIDRLSSHYNSHTFRFNSRFSSMGSEAVDALSLNWAGENNWLCPPVHLIPDTISHMKQCKAVGTLIVPCWPTAYFWPLLHSSSGVFAPFVESFTVLSKRHDLLVPGPGQLQLYRRKPPLFSACPSFDMLALRVDCRLVRTLIIANLWDFIPQFRHIAQLFSAVVEYVSVMGSVWQGQFPVAGMTF